MNQRAFETVICQSARSVTRRGPLRTLGLSGLAALIGSFSAEAGTKHNKHKKKQKPCPPPPTDRCLEQAEQCTTFISTQCGGDPACQDSVACCVLLETCDADGFFRCLTTAATN